MTLSRNGPRGADANLSSVTWTRQPFWSIRPAAILFWAVIGTQALATLIAVYGIFMAPIGWSWALFVWGYALAWFLFNDRVKLGAYKIFDVEDGGLMGHSWGKGKQQATTQ